MRGQVICVTVEPGHHPGTVSEQFHNIISLYYQVRYDLLLRCPGTVHLRPLSCNLVLPCTAARVLLVLTPHPWSLIGPD